MSDPTPIADSSATTDSDAPVTTPTPTESTVTPDGAATPQDASLAPDAGTQTDAAPPEVVQYPTADDSTPITSSTPAAGADTFDSTAPTDPTPGGSTTESAPTTTTTDAPADTAEDESEPATAELPPVPEDPTEDDDTTSGTVFADPTADASAPAPADTTVDSTPESGSDSTATPPAAEPYPTADATDTPSASVPDATTDVAVAANDTAPSAGGDSPVVTTGDANDAPPQATATVPIAGPSTDGLPAQDETAAPAPTEAPNTAAIGSGDPITDTGSPVTDPTGTEETPDTGIANQVEDDGSATGADSVSIPPIAYGGAVDGTPDAPDPEASTTPATPTETMPQAQDPASVRAPSNGMPANAYIPPTAAGDEPDTEGAAPLEGSPVSPIQAQTANTDDIVGDQPETVGTPYDVYEIQRELTSYIELVAELGLAINFIELAAFNSVANQRYELYAGDKIRVPHQAIPGRLDGVSYDDDDQDDAPLADENTSIPDRRDEYQNATSLVGDNEDEDSNA